MRVSIIRSTGLQNGLRRWLFVAALLVTVQLTCSTAWADLDFSGTPITFNTNGGWSWFSDPRSVIDNDQLIIGSIAGVTGNGSTAGDVDVTTYDFGNQALHETDLNPAFDQDDHADPSFAALPNGKVLVTYQTHGGDNNVHWRIGTFSGSTVSWGTDEVSTVNVTSDGNGNTYANPFYLSTPNEVVSFSRAIGYDPNYSVFNNLNNATPTFTYGGHWMYWKNPNNEALTGGNGRPYVKYASNGTNTVWFATTEDSPQNYLNSLYVGYMQFAANGSANVYTSTGTLLGGLSNGTAPTTGGSNPPSTGNTGPIASGSAGNFSYLPTEFTQIAKANGIANGFNLSSTSSFGAGYVGWASSMQLDSSGNPYIGFVVVRNLNGAYGNDLEYDYAHFVSGSWQVSRVGYAGLPLYNSQNQYAGLMAVDPLNPNKIYLSADVNPATDATLMGPDGHQHWQIFEGTTSNGGNTWSFTQLTNTSSDNVRPQVVTGSGEEALLWMQGTYTAYTSFNTQVVGLVEPTTAGDINQDGHVDAADIVALEQALANPTAYAAAHSSFSSSSLKFILDVNGDGQVNNADVQALINDLSAGHGSTSSVPEPASLLLLGLGSIFPLIRQIRLRRSSSIESSVSGH
jgi:BNR repeat-containing family member/Dockerin type I domain/PEP-CTERM motif